MKYEIDKSVMSIIAETEEEKSLLKFMSDAHMIRGQYEFINKPDKTKTNVNITAKSFGHLSNGNIIDFAFEYASQEMREELMRLKRDIKKYKDMKREWELNKDKFKLTKPKDVPKAESDSNLFSVSSDKQQTKQKSSSVTDEKLSALKKVGNDSKQEVKKQNTFFDF